MNRVVVYTKDNCVQCRATEKKLVKCGIDAEERSAVDHAAELKARGHLGAPVVVVLSPDGDVVDEWAGYRPERVAALQGTVATVAN